MHNVVEDNSDYLMSLLEEEFENFQGINIY